MYRRGVPWGRRRFRLPASIAHPVRLLPLAFLSINGIYRAMGETSRNAAEPQFTDHCFTGDYPTPLTDLAVAPPRCPGGSAALGLQTCQSRPRAASSSAARWP